MARKTKRTQELEEALSYAVGTIGTLEGLPSDLLAEALSASSALELARDDVGWARLSGSSASSRLEITDAMRVNTIKLARLYWHRDPMSKQAVRLWTAYSVGTGFTQKAKEDAKQTELDGILNHPLNRKIFNPSGQQKSSKRMLIDGEVFFAIFDTQQGKVARRIDPLQITKVITDPQDDETVVYYRRDVVHKNGRVTTKYFQDWTFNLVKTGTPPSRIKDEGKVVVPEKSVVIYHAAFDTLQNRGTSLLSTVVDWAKEIRRFMEARVAITQALARYVHKLKAKGGKAALSALKKDLSSTLGQGSLDETNPPPAAGSVWLENQGAELSATSRSTGAGDAKSDAEQLKLQFAAGVGVMLHYFGDPSTGNLATSTSMELPMLKSFQMYQQFWTDVYIDLFKIMLDDLEAEIDLDWPPIIEKDMAMIATVVTALNLVYPAMMEQDEIILTVFSAFGVNNIPDIIKKARVKEKENEAKAAQIAAGQPPTGAEPPNNDTPPGSPPGAPAPPNSEGELRVEVRKLLKEIEINGLRT